MDSIEQSNLNRQLLFTETNVGQPKSTAAVEYLTRRFSHLSLRLTGHVSRIQEFDDDFLRQFRVIIAGLDNLEARRWLNQRVLSLPRLNAVGEPDLESMTFLVDGGTEGFRGQARVIVPWVTSCFECSLGLFPAPTTYPLCTIASTPRIPEHCIEYALVVLWPDIRTEHFDPDDADHAQWIYEKALQRAKQFSIPGVTLHLTLGVVKRIVPAVASTNAVIAAVCVTETVKLVTALGHVLNNTLMFMGDNGVYASAFNFERVDSCVVCATTPVTVEFDWSDTLQVSLEKLEKALRVTRVSVCNERHVVFLQNQAMRAAYEPRLQRSLEELLADDLIREGEPWLVTSPATSSPYRTSVIAEEPTEQELDITTMAQDGLQRLFDDYLLWWPLLQFQDFDIEDEFNEYMSGFLKIQVQFYCSLVISVCVFAGAIILCIEDSLNIFEPLWINTFWAHIAISVACNLGAIFLIWFDLKMGWKIPAYRWFGLIMTFQIFGLWIYSPYLWLTLDEPHITSRFITNADFMMPSRSFTFSYIWSASTIRMEYTIGGVTFNHLLTRYVRAGTDPLAGLTASLTNVVCDDDQMRLQLAWAACPEKGCDMQDAPWPAVFLMDSCCLPAYYLDADAMEPDWPIVMHIRYPNVEKLAMGVLEPVSFDWPVDGYMQVLSVIHSLWFMFDSLLFFAWHDKLEYLLAFGAMIGMDVFTSEPISVSLWLHLGYLFCRMVGSIVRFKAFEEVLSLWENVLVQSLLDVFLFCLIVYMRFTVEIKERMDFISHRDHQHRIESLKAKLEIGAAGGTAQVRSGIEHLTDLVRSAKVGLETLIPGCRGHSALEECLEILSHTSTLHSVKFNNLSDNDTKTVETFMTAYDESKLGLKAQTTVLKKASEDRTPRFVRNMPLGLEEVGHRWDLDFITPFEDRKDSLYETALALLEPYLPDLDAPVEVVARFCRHLGASYFNNPYHNQTHGAVVAHCLEYLVRNVPLATTGFTRLERAGFIIAALAHDVCHPGKTNNFIVQSNDPIAILYNDNSPLENMHSCILFTLLEDPRCAVFESIEKSTLVGMKKLMIKMIMSTDMAFHFEVVSNFRVRRHAADFSVKKQEDAELLSGILIKCADISHVCMPWAQHMDWSLRVVEEFYQQGDAEMLMGMQVSAMCDKSTHRRFAKSQATFLEFIGIPIYAEVAKENRELEILTTTVKGNISHWEKLFRESQMINIPSELKQCKSAEHLALARTTLIDKIYTLYGKLEKHLQDMEIMALIAQDKIRNRGEVLKIHKHSQTSKELLMLAQSRHIQRQIRGELEPVVTKERPPPSSSSSSLVPEGASAHGSPRGSPRVRRVDSVAQNRKEKRRMLRQARRRRERRANAKFSQLLESGFMSSRELVGEKRRRSTAVSYIENHID